MNFSLPFNKFNYINVVAFLLSWALNSEVDLGPEHEFWSFLDGMRELGRRYESIVTPAGTTFLIAHLVLLLQGVFVVTQLLPKYNNHKLVEEGVGYWFLASVLAQLAWCMNFGLENIFGAFMSIVYMGVMVFCNSKILMTQAKLVFNDSDHTPEEYWLLRFPFSLHTGWNIAVFIMSINAFFHFLELAALIQLIIGFVSLAGFVGISYKMLLLNGDKPNYAIPGVLAWFLLGIAFGDNPAGGMEEMFSLGFNIISAVLGFGLAGFTGYLYFTREMNQDAKDGDSKATSYVAASLA